MVLFNKKNKGLPTVGNGAQIDTIAKTLDPFNRPVARYEHENLQRRVNQLEGDLRALTSHLGVSLRRNQTVVTPGQPISSVTSGNYDADQGEQLNATI